MAEGVQCELPQSRKPTHGTKARPERRACLQHHLSLGPWIQIQVYDPRAVAIKHSGPFQATCLGPIGSQRGDSRPGRLPGAGFWRALGDFAPRLVRNGRLPAVVSVAKMSTHLPNCIRRRCHSQSTSVHHGSLQKRQVTWKIRRPRRAGASRSSSPTPAVIHEDAGPPASHQMNRILSI